jgi:CRP-like cAMP-binding protein
MYTEAPHPKKYDGQDHVLDGQNHLIERLSRADRRIFLGKCEPVHLALAQVLCEPGMQTKYVHFPTTSFISLVASRDGSPGVEVGMVGSEGLLESQLVLGVAEAPMHAVVQGAGWALRIDAETFRQELVRSVPLRCYLNRYIYVLMAQLATSASCLRFHEVGPRLARWLLMTQDKARSDSFHVTQEFLSCMLGVRRVSVTTAASALQRRGLIQYRRGEVTVLDRRGLEAVACECYAQGCQVYSHLMH